jgi:O-antigen ligase
MNIKNMKWYNTLQFIMLCITFPIVAIDWQLGLWLTVAFGVATVVKIVAEKQIGNPSLDTPMRVTLCTVAVFWLCYVVSVLYSQNVDRALTVVSRKAVMLIVPLCILLSDTSYLRRDHLRVMLYGLLVAIGGLFFYNLFTNTFEERNHTYVALYILPTVGFIYSELTQHREVMPLWQKLMLYAAAVMTIVFIIYIDSRAGILCLYGVEVLCALHLAQKSGWRKGVLLALLSVGLTFTAEKTLPNHNSRLPIASLASTQAVETDDGAVADTMTTTAPAYGKYNDARMAINVTAVKTVAGSPVFGYGVGDYDTVLTERFGIEGYPSLMEQQLNAHNQYTETTLAIGIVGLAAMLWWLVMPLCVAWRRKAGFWPVLVLTFIVMFCLLFESMLERQMGMQFISLLYALMVLIMVVDQGKTYSGHHPDETKY